MLIEDASTGTALAQELKSVHFGSATRLVPVERESAADFTSPFEDGRNARGIDIGPGRKVTDELREPLRDEFTVGPEARISLGVVKSLDDVLSRAGRFKRSVLGSMKSERGQMPAETAFQIRLS